TSSTSSTPRSWRSAHVSPIHSSASSRSSKPCDTPTSAPASSMYRQTNTAVMLVDERRRTARSALTRTARDGRVSDEPLAGRRWNEPGGPPGTDDPQVRPWRGRDARYESNGDPAGADPGARGVRPAVVPGAPGLRHDLHGRACFLLGLHGDPV